MIIHLHHVPIKHVIITHLNNVFKIIEKIHNDQKEEERETEGGVNELEVVEDLLKEPRLLKL